MSKKISTDNTENYQLDQKYRPQSVDEIILPKKFKKAFKNYIKKGELPHLLLHSSEPGTGKTTTARAIVNDMELDPRYDYLFLKGDNVNVNYIKNELYDFCSSASPTGKRRVVIIDEYDRPTLGEAQRLMRTTIDEFSSSVTFIITANNPQNIHDALLNRMHLYNFGAISKEDSDRMKIEFFERMKTICQLENIEVTDDRILKLIISKHFPFFRTCLTELSKYAFSNDFVLDTGFLKEIAILEKSSLEVIGMLKSRKLDRDKLYAVAKLESYNFRNFVDGLYKDISKNIKPESQEDLIKIIGEMNKTYGMAGNVDFHLYYLLIQLHLNLNWNE